MSKNTIITIVLVILASGVGFFAGSKYQSSRNPFANKAFGDGQNFQFKGGQGVKVQNGQAGQKVAFRGGQVMGEIISLDDRSLTVKMPDGSSKIVLFTDTTTYAKSADAVKTDLKTGDTVAVTGETNSDGSVSATNIQLNPAFKMQKVEIQPQN